MKARELLTVFVIFAVLVVPTASAMCVDDSDATSTTQDYRSQLTSNQQIIYDALESLDPSTACVHEKIYGGAVQYAAKVTVPSTYVLQTSSAAELTNLVRIDMARAYQATLLDDPMAWWAWSSDNAYYAIFYTQERVANNQTFTLSSTSVSGFTFYVYVSDAYFDNSDPTTIASKVTAVSTAVQDLIDKKTVSGSTDVDKVKSINSYLCSDSFHYPDSDKMSSMNYSSSVYGAFVAKEYNDKHQIICTGFSQAFKLLCDKLGVSCTSVVGLAPQKVDNQDWGHMWNEVKINCSIGGKTNDYYLAVDVTFDKTGGGETTYLLCGAYSSANSVYFSQSHQPFAPLNKGTYFAEYAFTAYSLNDDGYTFPSSNDLLSQLTNYAPWIIIGVICCILAYVLLTVVRRDGGRN